MNLLMGRLQFIIVVNGALMDVDLEGALLVVVDGGVDGLPEVVGDVTVSGVWGMWR